MNSMQKKVLLIGSALVALMLLFPPWEYFDGDSSSKVHDGYHFLLTPPSRENIKNVFAPYVVRYPTVVQVRIDWIRLIIQFLAVFAGFPGLFLMLRSRRSGWRIAVSVPLFAVSVLAFVLWVLLTLGH
jgi:hypothetical protein